MHYDHARLRAAMAEAGDTNSSHVAEALSVHPATAWRLINGHSEPAAETLAEIERRYGITAADLFPAGEPHRAA